MSFTKCKQGHTFEIHLTGRKVQNETILDGLKISVNEFKLKKNEVGIV